MINVFLTWIWIQSHLNMYMYNTKNLAMQTYLYCVIYQFIEVLINFNNLAFVVLSSSIQKALWLYCIYSIVGVIWIYLLMLNVIYVRMVFIISVAHKILDCVFKEFSEIPKEQIRFTTFNFPWFRNAFLCLSFEIQSTKSFKPAEKFPALYDFNIQLMSTLNHSKAANYSILHFLAILKGFYDFCTIILHVQFIFYKYFFRLSYYREI